MNNGMEVAVHGAGAMMPVAAGGMDMDYLPAVASHIANQRRDMILDFYRNVMVPDVDFGKIPGTPKPTLLKPGAEKLCTYFGYAPTYETITAIERWGDDGREPLFFYRLKCKLYKQGRFIGEGEGSCSSWESKYRYRWVAEAELPAGLSRDKLISRGGAKKCRETDFFIEKAEINARYGKTEEYWAAFHAAIEDGTARRVKIPIKGVERDGWEISIDERQYRIPNPDIFDQMNTILKMAAKRAQVAATLTTTSASEFFTQDLEDMDLIQGNGAGSQAAVDAVASRKIEELQRSAPPKAAAAAAAAPPPPKEEKPFQKHVAVAMIGAYEPKLGSARFSDVLEQEGIKAVDDINDRETGQRLLRAMEAEFRQQQAELQGEDAEPGENTMQPITDADIPVEMGGTYVAERANPAANRRAR